MFFPRLDDRKEEQTRSSCSLLRQVNIALLLLPSLNPLFLIVYEYLAEKCLGNTSEMHPYTRLQFLNADLVQMSFYYMLEGRRGSQQRTYFVGIDALLVKKSSSYRVQHACDS